MASCLPSFSLGISNAGGTAKYTTSFQRISKYNLKGHWNKKKLRQVGERLSVDTFSLYDKCINEPHALIPVIPIY
jgi:hypothetical protein